MQDLINQNISTVKKIFNVEILTTEKAQLLESVLANIYIAGKTDGVNEAAQIIDKKENY
jgi:hypothetical protein